MKSTCKREATLSFVTPSRPIGASPSPTHKELAKGTLRALIRASGLTVSEFVDLL